MSLPIDLLAARKPSNKKSFFVKSPKPPQHCKTIFTRTNNFLADQPSFSEINTEYSFKSKPGSFSCGESKEVLLNVQNFELKPRLSTIYENEDCATEEQEIFTQEHDNLKTTASSNTYRKSSIGHFSKLKKKNLKDYNKFLMRKQQHFSDCRLNLSIKKIKSNIDHLKSIICLQNNRSFFNPNTLDNLKCSPVKIYSHYDLAPPKEILNESFFQVCRKKSLQSMKNFLIKNQDTTNFIIILLAVFMLTFAFVYYKEGDNLLQNSFDATHKPDVKMSIFPEPAKAMPPKTIYHKLTELMEMAMSYLW